MHEVGRVRTVVRSPCLVHGIASIVQMREPIISGYLLFNDHYCPNGGVESCGCQFTKCEVTVPVY